MKKRLSFIAALAVIMVGSVAFAAVSVPCGTRPAARKAAPVHTENDGFRRNVLDHKVPVETREEGNAMNDEATKYRDTLISGESTK